PKSSAHRGLSYSAYDPLCHLNFDISSVRAFPVTYKLYGHKANNLQPYGNIFTRRRTHALAQMKYC
ncbi:MAG: hypothetical protein ACXV8P_00925, partial [Methylobacter sp.]